MDEFVTVAALLLGPSGIVLGWWLAQLSDVKRDARTAAKEQDREDRARVVAVVDTAQNITAVAKALVLAQVQRYNNQPVDAEHYGEVVREYNQLRSRYGLLAAEAAIQGPPWASEMADAIYEAQRKANALVDTVMARLNAADLDAARDQLDAVEARIDELIAQARQRFSAARG